MSIVVRGDGATRDTFDQMANKAEAWLDRFANEVRPNV
jgi:hypothetical protein